MSLVDYIPDANNYVSYYKAEELENNPQLWVDSLSDEHIEVHSTNTDGKAFKDELIKLLRKNYIKVDFEFKNEQHVINGQVYQVPYAIINLNNAVPNVNQDGKLSEVGC